MKKGCLAGAILLALVLLSGCGASDADARRESTPETGSGIQEEQPFGIDSETIPESGEESQPGSAADDEGKDSSVQDNASGTEAGAVITEEILQQCREAFLREAENENLSVEEADALYQRLLDSGVMEYEEMKVTDVAAGDYDGNGCTDMVVCLYSLAEGADDYRDGCLYLFMNEDEPCRIYEKSCCYGYGYIADNFGADIDGDGKTEVIILVQGTGNGGPGDSCKFVVKYENPGIQQMKLPDNMTDDCGIEVTVEGKPEKKIYTAYCAELDQTIEFSANRAVDDMRGGNCRGYYSLKTGEYQGEEVLLGYEYLYAGGIADYVGDAVFVIGWDESGSPYIRDWYVAGSKLYEAFSDPVRSAYGSFLAGKLLLFDTDDIRTWGLNSWMNFLFPSFAADGELEYVYMDLDGDGVEELLIQHKDSPESYNGVFHYEGGRLYCWQHDEAEGSCRDYPLRDGTMVRQYDQGDNSSYTLFRYQNDGSRTEISNLYVRNELLNPSSTDSCPYYEVDGKEVDESTFKEQLKNLITDRRLEPSAWTILVP